MAKDGWTDNHGNDALQELTKEVEALKTELEQLGVLFPYEVQFFNRQLKTLEKRYSAYILTTGAVPIK